MTLLAVEGFDAKDISLKGWRASYSFNATAETYSATTPYSAGFSYQPTASSASTTTLHESFGHMRLITASAHIFAGLMINPVSIPDVTSGQKFLSLWGDSGTTEHLVLRFSATTGAFSLYRGATLLVAASTGLNLNSWNWVEIEATIDGAVGICNVNVNGTNVISFTGNTKNAGTNATIDAFYVGAGSFNNNAQINTILFDDLYICNSLGSANNALLGQIRVQTLLPTGPGSSTQFTPVSGANWSNVNDVPDSTATYNSDGTIGHRDTFAAADLASGTDTIFGVQQVTHGRNLDAGPNQLKNAQLSGSTVSYGSPDPMLPSVNGVLDLFEQNPATAAAWTPSDVNALEIGYEVSA